MCHARAAILRLRSGPFSEDTLVHAEQFLGLGGEGSITAPAAVRDIGRCPGSVRLAPNNGPMSDIDSCRQRAGRRHRRLRTTPRLPRQTFGVTEIDLPQAIVTIF